MNLLLFFFSLFTFINFSAPLKCYVCTYKDGMGRRECLDNPPSSSFLRECDSPQCYTNTATYNGAVHINRFCSYVPSPSPYKTYCQPSFMENTPSTECFCSTDACNSSPTTLPPSLLLLLISIPILLMQ